MDIITLLWSLSVAVALVLAMLGAAAWLIERRNRFALISSVVGLAAGATWHIELQMLFAGTTGEYGDLLRWYNLAVFCALGALLLLVREYLGTGRLWLLLVIVFMRSLLLVVNFSVDPNVNFREIVTLDHVPFLGEQVSMVGTAATRPWQWLALASLILIMVYLFDAVAQRWAMGDPESRRKAVVVGLGVVAPMVITAGAIHLAVFGALHMPLVTIPSMLCALFTTLYKLGRGAAAIRIAKVEVAELRAELAHTERVSTLGQLSSTLVHELAQPLTANMMNIDAALQKLQIEKPDIEELREILADIRSSEGRAADLIVRMRQLFRRREIELQQIDLLDVVQDVASLVQAQVTSKEVSLELRVQPGLSKVLGDRVHLTQVLLNLVLNGIDAVQCRPADARRIVIEARTDTANHQIEVSVQDSGPGISSAVSDKILQPFFTTKLDGMGMGLFLSRTIVEAHGGRLWSDGSKQNAGATFRFTLRCV